MGRQIDVVVKKALTKAKKVVISEIINREDKKDAGAKADLVNANMRYIVRFLNDEMKMWSYAIIEIWIIRRKIRFFIRF